MRAAGVLANVGAMRDIEGAGGDIRLTLKPATFSPHALIAGVLETCNAGEGHAQPVDWQDDPASLPAIAEADVDRVSQMLQNALLWLMRRSSGEPLTLQVNFCAKLEASGTLLACTTAAASAQGELRVQMRAPSVRLSEEEHERMFLVRMHTCAHAACFDDADALRSRTLCRVQTATTTPRRGWACSWRARSRVPWAAIWWQIVSSLQAWCCVCACPSVSPQPPQRRRRRRVPLRREPPRRCLSAARARRWARQRVRRRRPRRSCVTARRAACSSTTMSST
jgi:hypothetical protein